MVSIKIKFRTTKDEAGVLYYQIIHDRIVRQVNTSCRLNIREWDDSYSRLRVHSAMTRGDISLVNSWDKVHFECKRMEEYIGHLNSQNHKISADNLALACIKRYKSKSLYGFSLETIGRLKRLGNIANANIYLSTLVSFMTYRRGEDIELKELTSEVLEGYEAFLKHKEQGSSLNTISCYMRTLRAIFNRAVEGGLVSDKNIFKRVRTTTEKTAKRAIPLKYIKILKEADLSEYPNLAFSRDLFLFSFYTRGMSFVDIVNLKKGMVKNGEFTYRRSKTGQAVRVGWEECMEEIVQRYNVKESEYLLPIITDSKRDKRLQYITMRNKVNVNLKKIATMLDIPYNLTMYVARHTWASTAKAKNISISVISEAMGHDSEATTRIYLASLDTEIIDDANRLIIGSL